MKRRIRACCYLCSLSESFDPLVMILLYGKETLVYVEIISVLRSNEQ